MAASSPSHPLAPPHPPQHHSQQTQAISKLSQQSKRNAPRNTKTVSPSLSAGGDVGILQEMFPAWSAQDLASILEEASGDLDRAISRITEGHVNQWALSGQAGKRQREAERKEQERLRRQQERQEQRQRQQREQLEQRQKPVRATIPNPGQPVDSWAVVTEAAPAAAAKEELPASWADAAVSLMPAEAKPAVMEVQRLEEKVMQAEEAKPVKYYSAASRQQPKQAKPVEAQATLAIPTATTTTHSIAVEDDLPVVMLPASLANRRQQVELEPNVVLLPVKAHVRTLSNISFGPATPAVASPASVKSPVAVAPTAQPAITTAAMLETAVAAQHQQQQAPRYQVASVEAHEPASGLGSNSTQAPPGLGGFEGAAPGFATQPHQQQSQPHHHHQQQSYYQDALLSPTLRSGMVASRSSPNLPSPAAIVDPEARGSSRVPYVAAAGHFGDLAAEALMAQQPAGYYQQGGRAPAAYAGRGHAAAAAAAVASPEEQPAFESQPHQLPYAQQYGGYAANNAPYARYGNNSNSQQQFYSQEQAYYANTYAADHHHHHHLMGRSMPYQQQPYAAGYYNQAYQPHQHQQQLHPQQQQQHPYHNPSHGYSPAPSRPSGFGKPSAGSSASSGSPRAF